MKFLRHISLTLTALTTLLLFFCSLAYSFLGQGLLISTKTAAQVIPQLTCPNILNYGGKGDGVTPNDAVWVSALAGSLANKPCIYFPAGRYLFNSQVTVNLSTGNVFAMFGDAPDITTLVWNGGGGVLINGLGNSTAFHVRDMSFVTGAVGVGAAIDAEWGSVHNSTAASSTIERVRIAGNAPGTTFWNFGVKLYGVSQVNINGVDISGQLTAVPTQGNCVDISAPDNNLSFIYRITNSNFLGCFHGISYGSGIQGVFLEADDFVKNTNGIYVAPSTPTGLQAQLNLSDSEFEHSQGDSVLIDTGATLTRFFASNNLFYMDPGFTGINIKTSSGGEHIITNNQFVGTAGSTPMIANGIALDNANYTNLITNTRCHGLKNCIIVGPNATGVTIKTVEIDAVNTEVAVLNNGSTSLAVTGFLDWQHLLYPESLIITAANSSAGAIQLTVSPDSGGLVVGEIVMVSAPGLANQPALYRIGAIPNTTSVILDGSAYSGSLTGNGIITVVP